MSVIQHNISALNTQRNLGMSNTALSKSLEKLSSGFRINVAADGPADLIISEQLRAQNIGLERAVRNTQEAINVLGTAKTDQASDEVGASAAHDTGNPPAQQAADNTGQGSGHPDIGFQVRPANFFTHFICPELRPVSCSPSSQKWNGGQHDAK